MGEDRRYKWTGEERTRLLGEVARRYLAGESSTEIGPAVGASASTVIALLREAGVPVRTGDSRRYRRCRECGAVIEVRWYCGNACRLAFARRRREERLAVEAARLQVSGDIWRARLQVVREMREGGMKLREIADTFGVARGTVSAWLRKTEDGGGR